MSPWGSTTGHPSGINYKPGESPSGHNAYQVVTPCDEWHQW